MEKKFYYEKDVPDWDYIISLVDSYKLFIIKTMKEYGYDEYSDTRDLIQMAYLYAYEFVSDIFKKENKELLIKASFPTLFTRHLKFKMHWENRKHGFGKLVQFPDFFEVQYKENFDISDFEIEFKIEETLEFILNNVLSNTQRKLFRHIFRFCDNDCCDGNIHIISEKLNITYSSAWSLYNRGILKIKEFLKNYDLIYEFSNKSLYEYIFYLDNLAYELNKNKKNKLSLVEAING
jgi:hypothetical protein